ncbi:MAG: SDR family NAD(P)-dependent oxidoreductase [Candidatus Cybelea sp.]|jgi:NAD(P)-dependent dehydrogenase (short-subunit alcohol dehydrogenase family)
MPKTIVIVGYGPGTAASVAEKFGKEGFSVALIGRNEERLAAGVSALKARGVTALGFPGDASDPASIRSAIRAVHSQLGPITVMQWNAYGGEEAGDLLAADPASLHRVFDVAIFGLLAATSEALSDLKKSGGGAILVANGAFGEVSPEADESATNFHAMGVALANAAKNKLVGLLAQRLKGDGVYVGQIMVDGTIKGTPTGSGNAINPAVIAGKYWELYRSRGETRAVVKPA